MEMTVYEFFELVKTDKVCQLEIENFVQQITDNFKKDKLIQLLTDIENYLSVQEYKRECEIKEGVNLCYDEIFSSEEKELSYTFFHVYTNLISFINEKIKPTHPEPPEPETNQFKELFKPPYNSDKKIKDLKDILKTYKHIDNNEKWTGITKDKNELATLYWLFEEKNNILNPGKVTPHLKTFYKEFGLIVYTDKEPTGYCTIKNINKHPGQTSNYKHFASIFNNWINKG
jgi:hypothetical protein